MEKIDLLPFLIYILLIIVLFFIFRGLNLWYFRINSIVSNQEKNNQLLAEIASHLKPKKELSPVNTNKINLDELGILDNKRVVLSGEFVGMGLEKVENHLKEQGAIISRHLTLDSEILLTGRNPHHGDVKAAKANNIEVISFEKYLRLNDN